MDISKILKSDYLDILFEGRNKTYGGYELRKKYPTRARNAAIGTIVVAALIAAGPVIASMKKEEKKKPIVSMKQVTLAEPPPIEPNKPKPPPPPPAPPAPARPTVKFTPPVIKPNEEVKEDVKPPDEKKNEVSGPVTAAGDANASELAPPTETPGTGTGPVEAPAAPQIFKYVEQMPQFPGDVSSYLASHLQYPESAREGGIEGRVGIQFVVNETGDITNVEVTRSSGNGALDNEAKRVVSGMPKWKPGKNNGTAVKVYYTLPITFKLD